MKKRCGRCQRFFVSERKSRKFCSSLCYHVASRIPSSHIVGIKERKRLMAMAVHHDSQLKTFASILNSSKAPEVEKISLLIMAIRESHDAQRIVLDTFRASTPSERKSAKKLLASNVGRKKTRGPLWCKTCGSVQVSTSYQDCQSCIEKRYTSQDLQDAIEPFNRVRDRDAV